MNVIHGLTLLRKKGNVISFCIDGVSAVEVIYYNLARQIWI